MITGLAHACFTVSDLDATLDFYCGKLGLKEVFPFLREDGSKMGAYVHAGGRTFLEFFAGKPGERAEGQSYGHVCLEVDDIVATAAGLRRRGVEVTDVKMGKDRSLQAWLSDPDGNRIELHQYTPESRQNAAFE